jgi:hypothetical protein
MAKTESEILRLILRIKTSPDGEDFIKYLETLSDDNYNAWKRSDPNVGDIHKGYAQCIDNIIKLFQECGRGRNKPKTPSIQ